MKKLIALLALLSTTVSADPYVGVSFGKTSVEIGRLNIPGTFETVDDTGSGFRLFAGSTINPNVSLEFGYLDAGEFSQNITDFIDTLSSKITGNIIDFSVIGKSDAGLYGRVGLYQASLDAKLYFNGFTVDSASASNSNILFGFGYETPSENARLRIDYTKYLDVGTDSFGKSDVDFISVGIVIPIH